MLNKSSIIILYVLVFIIGGISIYNLISKSKSNQDKIVYVNISKLFNEFEMKKELEVQYNKAVSSKQKQLDSLKMDLQLLKTKAESSNAKKDIDVFHNKQMHFFEVQEIYQEQTIELTDKFDGQIMAQLRQYIKDYGEQNNIEIMLGLDDSSTILYGTVELEKTTALIDFVNQKYQGK